MIVGGIQLCNLPLTVVLLHYIDNPIISYIIAIILALASAVARVVITSELTSLAKKDFIVNVICRVILASIIPIALVIFVKKIWTIEGLMIIPTYLMFEVVLLIVFYAVSFSKKEKGFLRSIISVKKVSK